MFSSRWRCAILTPVLAIALSSCSFASSTLGQLASSDSPKSQQTRELTDVTKVSSPFKTSGTIQPTAIVLHWWGSWSDGDINGLMTALKHNRSRYNPKLASTDRHPFVGHTTVQFGVTGVKSQAYQLTPQPNSFARHAKCANSWAIGIEIEGSGPNSDHYIGNNTEQFEVVVSLVKDLVDLYDIPLASVVAKDGRSGRGILSHAMVDRHCQWSDGQPAGSDKIDVDRRYLNRVIKAVKSG